MRCGHASWHTSPPGQRLTEDGTVIFLPFRFNCHVLFRNFSLTPTFYPWFEVLWMIELWQTNGDVTCPFSDRSIRRGMWIISVHCFPRSLTFHCRLTRQ